jgi:hypothetical protein
MNEGAYRGHNLVFIVGSPRSGTTWLQRLLASHEKIHTGQEPCLFARYVGPQLRVWRWELTRENSAETSTGRGGIGLSCYFQEQEFVAILRDYMCRLLRPMIGSLRPGELFVDKTPMNALYLPEIRELLPESRFIHLIRDPRDVVASFLAASRSWGSGWAPRRTKTAIKSWVKHVGAVNEAAKNIPRRLFFEVRYERLSAVPEDTLSEIGEFLGLEWRPGAIQNAVQNNKAETVRAGGGTPIPLYGEVAKRAGGVVRDPADFIRYAEDSGRANLRLRDKCVIWYAAKQIMRQTGYSWSWRDWKGF